MEENPSVPDKVELTSMDVTADRIEDLKAVFPEAFHDGKIDFDYLRSALGDWVEPEKERFGLTWAGKAQCMKVIQQPSIGTLVPMREESVKFDTTENLIIEGDNLEVLKLLQKSYYGKIKMIYIDPPYNTGNEFIYPDDYKEGLGEYLRYSGQIDSEGLKLTANSETSGRYHSKWLSMMYPRLYLAKNLLRDDGVIFISIDDNEHPDLRFLCNEVFGEENFIANVIWQKKYTRANDAKYFSDNHDHVLVVARNKECTNLNLLTRTEEQESAYSNPDNHPKGPWKATPLHAKSGVAVGFSYTFNNGTVWSPPPGTYPRYSLSTLQRFDETDEIWFGTDGKATPSRKTFLAEAKSGVTATTIWLYDEVGHNHEANSELKEVALNGVFDNPKPTRLIRRMLELITVPFNDEIILDFFAGSGTTAHAVMAQNIKDNGNRKFILVQLPEPTDRDDFPTISAITRERVRRAGKAILNEPATLGSTPPDCGFKAYKLTTSNFKVWDSENDEEKPVQRAIDEIAVNVVQGRSEEDILTELLLKSGYSLTTSVTQVTCQGKQVYSVEGGKLLICLEKKLAVETFEAMADMEPEMIIVLDAGFEGEDELKVNAMETIRLRNRHKNSDIVLRVV